MTPGAVGRVKARATFDAFRRPTSRARRGPLRIRYLAPSGSEGGSPVRVAYAISKPFGSAVRRNRARRRLRSAVGMVADQARAGAYLVSAEPEVLQMEFSELVGLVRDAMMGAAAGGIVPPTTVLGTGGAS